MPLSLRRVLTFKDPKTQNFESGWFLVLAKDGSMMYAWYERPDNLFYTDTGGERYIPDVVGVYPLDNPLNHSRGTTLLLQELDKKAEDLVLLMDKPAHKPS